MANYTSTHTGATIDASVTIVSSSGVTQSDLTKLNAVTSSAVELNLLDGVTASTAEINILDGLTATTAELNYLDGADSSITTLSLPDNTTITTFGASLIDDADAASARTTLGVDVAGTDNSTDVTLVTTSHDYLSITGQAITLGSIDISDDTNLVGGTGITLTGDTLSTTDSEIVHDNLSGFVANEHIDHSTVSISAGTGLSGGGDLTSTRTLSIDSSVVTLSGTQTLANKSISGTANTISNVHIVDDTINTLTIARGGTGGTTASEARSNLNVDVAGTDNSTDVTLVTTSHDYLSLSGQAITLGTIDIGDDTNLTGGTGITLTGDTLSTTDSEIVHDDLSGFVSNEHIDHSTVSITAGTGLSGGGDITTSRTLTTDDSAIVHDNLSGFVANEHIDHSGVSITAGAGLTGGGDITATRDIAVGAGTGVTVNADDIAIGQDVATTADVEFNSVTADIIGDIRGATKFQAKADVALNKGDAVYISGVSGTTPTVDIADANDSAKMPSFGLAASSVSINASVEIITFGTLSGLNTSGFTVGDILFISTNGTSGNTLTATAPSGETSLIQNIGIVQRSHASAGSIKVGGAGRTNATPNLDDGDIFIGNGSNQAVTASLNTKIEDYLDGGTSTANFDTISVDGAEITATPAELNVLDGITSTTAELNYTDGVTSNIQTQLDAKAPLASPAFTGTATGANLTLSGDLTVNGSTTTLDTTNLAVEDNLMELNAGVTSNANDSGFLIERGSTGDNAIFMWDESADKFTLGTTTATGTTTGDITLSSTGTLVASLEGDVTGDVTGNADTATTLATARNFSLTGDVTAGAVSFDGSGNVALSTTIAANSVALGTDTTGNYMSDLTEGTGIDITHTPAEGSNATIALDLTEVGFGGGANRLITDDGDGTVSTESNLTFDAATGNFSSGDGSESVTHEPSSNYLTVHETGASKGSHLRLATDNSDFILTAGGSSNQLSLYDVNGVANRLIVNSSGLFQFSNGISVSGDATFDTDTLKVDSTNNRVGIGTNSPGYKLDVAGQGKVTNGWLVDNGTTAGFFTTDTDNVNFGASTSGKGLKLFSANAEAMRIDSSGNVGIATNSPAHKLEVEVDTNVFVGFDNSIGGTAGDKVMFVGWGGSNAYGRIQPIHQGTAYKDLVLNDSGGNVGIGTTSPAGKLMVREDIAGNPARIIVSNSGTAQSGTSSRLSFYEGTSEKSYIERRRDGTGKTAFVTPADDNPFVWENATGEFMRFTNSNVGIGTNSPTAKLVIDGGGDADADAGDASEYSLLINQDNNDKGIAFGFNGADNKIGAAIIAKGSAYSSNNKTDLQFYVKGTTGTTAPSNVMTLQAGGNVGIGTTSPGYKLDVAGEIAIRGAEGADDARMYFQASDNSNRFTIETDLDGTTTNDLLGFRGAATDNILVLKGNGNVGIGTESPGTKLHISSGATDEVLRLEGTGSPYLSVYDSGTRQFFLQSSGNTVNFYAENDNTIAFFTSGNRGLDIDANRNLKIYDNGTNPTASTNNAFLFCDSGELKVLDELGNTTTISPHNFDLIPGGASEDRAWGYYSEKDIVDDEGNVTATQKVNVDMMKLARLVEELTGEKLVYTEED